MIGTVSSDDFCLASHHSCNLEGGFIRLSAGGGEEELLEAFRQDFDQERAQRRPDICRVPGTYVGKLPSLLLDCCDDGLILVTERYTHQLCGEIQILLAVGICEVASLGIDDMERFPSLLKAPGPVSEFCGDFYYLL